MSIHQPPEPSDKNQQTVMDNKKMDQNVKPQTSGHIYIHTHTIFHNTRTRARITIIVRKSNCEKRVNVGKKNSVLKVNDWSSSSSETMTNNCLNFLISQHILCECETTQSCTFSKERKEFCKIKNGLLKNV